MNKKISDKFLRELFYGNSKRSDYFNYFLILLNISVFALFALENLYPGSKFLLISEIAFGTIFLVEYIIRLKLSPRRISFVFSFYSFVDILVIISLFSVSLIGNLAILRIVRIFKILNIYKILIGIKLPVFLKYKDIIFAVLHFVLFTILMSVSIFVTQVSQNSQIETYLDAVYFTVSTLTTTGFGDITPVGDSGKIVSIVTMIFGITLFLNLARRIIYRKKAFALCKYCGLRSHDKDASHCKHCGHVIKIETEGFGD